MAAKWKHSKKMTENKEKKVARRKRKYKEEELRQSEWMWTTNWGTGHRREELEKWWTRGEMETTEKTTWKGKSSVIDRLERGQRAEWISRISRAWSKTREIKKQNRAVTDMMGENQQEEWARASFSSSTPRRGISIRAAGVSPPSGHQSLSLFLQTSLALFLASFSFSSFDKSHSLPPSLFHPVVSLLVAQAYKTFQSDEAWCWIDFQRELILDRHQGVPNQVWDNTREQQMIGSDGYVGWWIVGGANHFWWLPLCSSTPRMHQDKCDLLLVDNDVPPLKTGPQRKKRKKHE